MTNLRYADDTIALASDEAEMADLLNRIETRSAEFGLKLNRSKCVMMVIDKQKTLPALFARIPDIEKRDKVIYLGAKITNNGDCDGEIQRRIGMAKTAMACLSRIWKDHNITKGTKLRLVKALVFPIATYGSETWTIKAASRRRIEAFEMTTYRRMLKIPWTARRTNISFRRELNIEDHERLLPTIQRRILSFFGHSIRRDGMEKLCIQGKVDGRRRRGKSPNRYIDQIKDLTNLPVPELMRRVKDRQEWRRRSTMIWSHDA